MKSERMVTWTRLWPVQLTVILLSGWSGESRVDDWSPCNAKDSRITTERPAALSGRWVSRRCEVRQGPHYLLRAYEFGYNTSFLLHQFYYSDDCVTPLHSFTIHGILSEMKKSWLLPGAIDVDYTLTRVTVMPYTQDQADLLQIAVLRVCPLAKFSAQSWPPYEEQEILNFDPHPTTPGMGAEKGVTRIDVEFDCLEALNFTFDELHLIRMQRRRWLTEDGVGVARKELYSGESPRAIGKEGSGGDIQRPVSYLPDYLVKVEADAEKPECPVCDAIDSVTSPSHPPILNASSSTPPFYLTDLSGKFASLSECESRPSGSFTRRIMTFHPETFEWQGEYQHFTEPDCQQRSFTILGAGTFTLEEPYHLLPMAQKIDFLVINATVTPHLDFVLQQLASSNETDCGMGPWTLNRPKDITPTNGCHLLGLTIPNADFNVIRMEHDKYRNTYLYMGQDHQESGHHGQVEVSSSRPTSFQPPLIQCKTVPPPKVTSTKTVANNRQITMGSSTESSTAGSSTRRPGTRRRNGAQSNALRSQLKLWMFLSMIIIFSCALQT